MKSDVSLLRRMGAISYDALLCFSLVFFIMFVVTIFTKNQPPVPLIYLIIFFSVYLYFHLSWTKGGQTLGMKAWRVKIIQINGENITPKQVFIRFILAIISFLFFGFGFIYQLFDKQNIAFHDKLSKTFLIKGHL